jgi:hypothetical protein
MSSDERPEKGKQPVITRSKQSRRKMLKSMAAGSGAVIAGKSMPDEWAKPMVDSVLLPVHAQTSGPTSCTVSGNVAGTHQNPIFDGIDNGLDNPPSFNFGPYAIPGDYVANDQTNGTITAIPTISVTPGVTDTFSLTTVVNGAGVVNPGTNLSQTGVTPDPVNGAIVFNSIETDPDWSGDNVNVAMTLTPDNASFCGGPQVIDINFGP